MILFTIGYEGLDQDQFIKYLNLHNVDVVADVRQLPASRKKGFSKTTLQEALNKNRIEYLNFRELGAPKPLRDELHQSGNYKRFFIKYQRLITENNVNLQTIQALVENGKKVALLCFERDPEKCHRKVVAEKIEKLGGNGLSIKHIIPF